MIANTGIQCVQRKILRGIRILSYQSRIVTFPARCTDVPMWCGQTLKFLSGTSSMSSAYRVCNGQVSRSTQYIHLPKISRHSTIVHQSFPTFLSRCQFHRGEGSPGKKVDPRIIYAVYLSGVIGSMLLFVILKREFDKARNRVRGIEEVYNDLYGRRTKFIKYKDVLLPGFVEKTLKDVEQFEVREDDIWVVSYPRSGTTWTQEIVYLIHSDLDFEAARAKTIEERFPYLEYVYPGIKQLDSLPSPRLIKSHLPLRLLPEDISKKKPKIIYVVRNPKDVAVSCFYFVKMLRPVSRFSGTFEQFFDSFVHDKASYSPWWRHVKEFWDERNEGNNILFVMYEDIHKDPEGSIQRIATFLDKSLTISQARQISQHCSFDNMRKNDSVNFSWWADLGITDKKETQFLRKGQVGDWRQHLTPEMSLKIDRMCSWKFQNTGLVFDFGTPEEQQDPLISDQN